MMRVDSITVKVEEKRSNGHYGSNLQGVTVTAFLDSGESLEDAHAALEARVQALLAPTKAPAPPPEPGTVAAKASIQQRNRLRDLNLAARKKAIEIWVPPGPIESWTAKDAEESIAIHEVRLGLRPAKATPS